MKLIVTGGAGFIGSAVVRHILANTKDTVINLDKLTYASNTESIPPQLRSERLRSRMKELATQYPRYGYLLLHGLLKAEELVVNKKRTYRLYTEEGLQVRTKKRKKLTRPRLPMDVPRRIDFNRADEIPT